MIVEQRLLKYESDVNVWDELTMRGGPAALYIHRTSFPRMQASLSLNDGMNGSMSLPLLNHKIMR